MPKGKLVFQIIVFLIGTSYVLRKSCKEEGDALRHGKGENKLHLLYGFPGIFLDTINGAQWRMFYP